MHAFEIEFVGQLTAQSEFKTCNLSALVFNGKNAHASSFKTGYSRTLMARTPLGP